MRCLQAVLTGAALLAASSMCLAAQERSANPPQQQNDRDAQQRHDREQHANDDHRRQNNSRAYEEGLRMGQADNQQRVRTHERSNRWTNDRDRNDYAAGYRRGYGSSNDSHDRDYDRDRRDRGRGYGNNGMQVAQQHGYDDGVNEGRLDRQNGHSFRPTHDRGYQLATNGYEATFGTRQQYQQWYRQTYQQGYEAGYNGNARRR